MTQNTSPGINTKAARLDSVDILRGIVMVLMALDHVRDFFHADALLYDPLNLSQTSVLLYFTRWITHFCAPVFVFLAGTGAFLSTSRGKTIPELSRFLWTRGLMLVIFELTIIEFGWKFNFANFWAVQVIWAIGVSMICLAVLVHLRVRTIGIIGIVMIACHNLLDGIKPEAFGDFSLLWKILHVSEPTTIFSVINFWPIYPLIPWIGVMAAGYAFGTILLKEPARRRKILLQLGLGMTTVFVVLRAVNMYGDLLPWTMQKDPVYTMLSFLNATKYPPSLDYVLMTLGPSIALLAVLDKGIGRVEKFFVVYGRVPMFYYIIHIYFIHLLAIVAGAAQGYDATVFFNLMFAFPKGYGFSLPGVYVIWISIVLALYPVCKWYGALKRRRKDPWMSYI
ncbi:MAG: heparan-alpha-glucosaminide N-acetyltransferase domain-containing protein [bacterium]